MRYFQGRKEYTVTDGIAKHTFQSGESLAQGSIIEAKEEGGALSDVKVLEGGDAKEAWLEIRDNVKGQMELGGPAIVDDDVTRKLWPEMERAAVELMAARRTGRAVMLRFHGDADGICGAFAITDIVRCKVFQQNSAIYTVKDALRDLSGMGQEALPLIVLLDFASNDASKDGLQLLEAAGMQYLIIDHHPPGDPPPEGLVSPFSVTEEGSGYTAGYLACEIAACCGMDIGKASELARIACSGDKSTVLPHGDSEREKARVLDFLAAHISFGNNLEFYAKVMEKEELFRSIARQAEDSIEDAAAKVKVKTIEGEGLDVVTFQLDSVVKKGEWPPAGKITTCIFEKLKGDKALLCVGFTERSLIIRMNDAAVALGLSANELAKGVVESMADFVDGGGGHAKAGAIRVRPGFAKDVLGELVRRAEETGRNEA